MHLDHLFDFGTTAVASACSLCQDRVFPSCPDFGSDPWAQTIRERRWRHIEHLLFEYPGISSVGGSLAVNLLRDDLFRACSGSDHATAALLATFPSDRTPIVAATTCAVPFLLDPADALGRHPPWRMKLQCLALAAEFLLACGCAWCLRRAPGCLCPRPWWQAFAFLLGRPSARGCSACGSVSAPPLLPAPAPVLHMSAPVRRGAVADARLGLA